MCQIDWDAKENKALSQGINRRFAIASLISFQLSAIAIIPMPTSAETQSKPSFQEDPPEEVLRAEIYTDARSPIDGKQLTAAEYTELMEKLRSLDSIPPEDLVSPKVVEVIGLLKLRKFLKQFIPFIP